MQAPPGVEVVEALIGSVGIFWDIREFYKVFELDENFWHLKLFLLKEELKAESCHQDTDKR